MSVPVSLFVSLILLAPNQANEVVAVAELVRNCPAALGSTLRIRGALSDDDHGSPLLCVPGRSESESCFFVYLSRNLYDEMVLTVRPWTDSRCPIVMTAEVWKCRERFGEHEEQTVRDVLYAGSLKHVALVQATDRSNDQRLWRPPDLRVGRPSQAQEAVVPCFPEQ